MLESAVFAIEEELVLPFCYALRHSFSKATNLPASSFAPSMCVDIFYYWINYSESPSSFKGKKPVISVLDALPQGRSLDIQRRVSAVGIPLFETETVSSALRQSVPSFPLHWKLSSSLSYPVRALRLVGHSLTPFLGA